MLKKYKLLFILILGILLVGGGFLYFKPETPRVDAKYFKEEYEQYNDTIRESDGAKYSSITIDENNPIKYVDTLTAIKILKSRKAIIYAGAGWCPWCRNAVISLLEVAKKYDIKTIYYLNLDNEKDEYIVKDTVLIRTKEGSEGYYKLLDKLSAHLPDYKIKDENGKEYDIKEKRIYLPTIFGIKNGEVVEKHTGTVKLNDKQTKYDPLTEEQRNELNNIYSNIFEKVYK